MPAGQQKKPGKWQAALRREAPAAILYALAIHFIVVILMLNTAFQIRIIAEDIPAEPEIFTIAATSSIDEVEEEEAEEDTSNQEASDPSSALTGLPNIPVETIDSPPPSDLEPEPKEPTPSETTNPDQSSESPMDLMKEFAASSGDGRVASGGYAGRSATGRIAGLRKNGGSRATEDAVGAGLAWLASVQELDDPLSPTHGSWDGYRFARHYLTLADGQESISHQRLHAEGGRQEPYRLGLSALTLLAFTGHGEHVGGKGKYAKHVQHGLEYLRRQQDAEGAFHNQRDRGSRGNLYDHSLALLAIADHAAMIGSKRDEKVIQKAVDILVSRQEPTGGWDYSAYPREDRDRSDLSISGWAVMALIAAKSAGATVPESTIKRVVAYLKAATTPSGMAYYSIGPEIEMRTGYTMTAVNLYLRRLLGESPESRVQKRQLAQITKFIPDYEQANLSDRDPYAWYYTSLAMLIGDQSQDKKWLTYNAALQRSLLGAQEKHGVRAGSWPPTSYYGMRAGRIYSTTMGVLALESYYRYQPASLQSAAKAYAPLWE